ncbi:MAG: hypothetical protein ACI97A_000923 [Planctomycetota bacterium]|jgi:hypothetical protein
MSSSVIASSPLPVGKACGFFADELGVGTSLESDCDEFTETNRVATDRFDQFFTGASASNAALNKADLRTGLLSMASQVGEPSGLTGRSDPSVLSMMIAGTS